MKKYSSRTADKFVLRLLDGMRDHIKTIADSQHRSMNSELIAWVEMVLSVYADTGSLPNLNMLRSTAQLSAQNAVMRALFVRLLDAGQWFPSAVEFDSHDHHVDGEAFKKEIQDILAQAVPNVNHGIPQVENLQAGPQGIQVTQGPQFIPNVGNPVRYGELLWVLQSYSVRFNDDIYVEISRGVYGNPGHDTKHVLLKDLLPL